ncbi:MAG: oxygen-independent coproporphyrinogen III oxidase [Bdellovibrionales bacterium]
MKLDKELLAKYDVPVPRYTSYPTVPYWSDSPSTDQWISALKKALTKDATWSMYVHIPFCETLCTFCGCNTVITKDHKRETPYVQAILTELELYRERCPELFQKPMKQIHLGGGTPTFLAAPELKSMCKAIFDKVKIDAAHFEGSVEVDPRRTSREQLKVLRELGFSRVSMGVQDFDPEVQRLVNRVQPLEQTKALTEASRELGYTSVNYDLIYGLPKQTIESFKRTAEATVQLRPDRIALYSFALVPWIKPQQRLFKDSDLPVGADKRALYELGYEILTNAGYIEIGMDHFALPEEALAQAAKQGHLHRNFMGYTEQRTDILLGLGVSSISEAPGCFHQNEKVLPVYERRIQAREIPTLRGHVLSEDDRFYRELILKFMTQLQVKLPKPEMIEDAKQFLAPMIQDGLVQVQGDSLSLTEAGRPFLRNACVLLDHRMRLAKPQAKVFSQAM